MSFDFESLGYGVTLYGLARLGTRQDGYSFNPVTNEIIPDWKATWFLIGDEASDPCMVDLASSAPGVQMARHGAGAWTFSTDTRSIGALLVCCAAVHHAVTHWEREEGPDETYVYNVDASAWLTPVPARWAGDNFDRWYTPW